MFFIVRMKIRKIPHNLPDHSGAENKKALSVLERA
jgi:hypothetical protein